VAVVNGRAIGYLLEILDISVANLSRHIFIEQSLISKWKNGTRILKKESPHYEKILNYFIDINNKDKTCILEKFFSNIYPAEGKNEMDYLKNCLNMFLSESDISLTAAHHYETEKNALYHSGFYVYKDFEGRKNAFRMLLDAAEALPEPEELYIIDKEQFLWITKDEDFLREWADRMIKILDSGTKIILVHCIYNVSLHYKILYKKCWNVFCHRNMTTYYYTKFFEDTPSLSYYVLKNHMSMVGMHLDDKEYSYYSAVYTDPFTCYQFEGYIKNVIERKASKRYKLKTGKDKMYILNLLKTFEKSSEPLYFSGRLPNLGFMSEKLIDEILKSNNASKQSKKICKSYHGLIRNIMRKERENHIIKHIYYTEDFEEALKHDTLINKEISGIAGMPIVITNKQLREHLQDMAALLKEGENVKVCITTKGTEQVGMVKDVKHIACWCKRNLWYYSSYAEWGNTIFSLEGAVCSVVGSLYEDMFEKDYSVFGDKSACIKYIEKIVFAG